MATILRHHDVNSKAFASLDRASQAATLAAQSAPFDFKGCIATPASAERQSVNIRFRTGLDIVTNGVLFRSPDSRSWRVAYGPMQRALLPKVRAARRAK